MEARENATEKPKELAPTKANEDPEGMKAKLHPRTRGKPRTRVGPLDGQGKPAHPGSHGTRPWFSTARA